MSRSTARSKQCAYRLMLIKAAWFGNKSSSRSRLRGSEAHAQTEEGAEWRQPASVRRASGAGNDSARGPQMGRIQRPLTARRLGRSEALWIDEFFFGCVPKSISDGVLAPTEAD